MNNLKEKSEELFDVYSEYIDDSSEGLQKVGGTSVLSKRDFDRLIKELIVCNEDYKAKYEKCIDVIKRFDAGIIGMYDL